jgi:hypothetical protein
MTVPLLFALRVETLQHGLHVQRKTLRRPLRADAAKSHGFGNIRLDRRRVIADACLAGIADLGIGLVDFLHHRSDKTRKLRNVAGKEGPAEIDVTENPLERIGMAMIGRGREQRAGRLGPIVGRRDGNRFLALEVMKEGPLRHARFGAKLIDRRRDVALGADHGQSGLQQLASCCRHAGAGWRFGVHG